MKCIEQNPSGSLTDSGVVNQQTDSTSKHIGGIVIQIANRLVAPFVGLLITLCCDWKQSGAPATLLHDLPIFIPQPSRTGLKVGVAVIAFALQVSCLSVLPGTTCPHPVTTSTRELRAATPTAGGTGRWQLLQH